MYGLIFACAKAWNATCKYENFNELIDFLHYGYNGAGELVNKLANLHIANFWYDLCVHYSNAKFNNNAMRCNTPDPDALNEAFNKCEELIPYLSEAGFEIVAEYKRTGTVMFTDGVNHYEYTAFRKEKYLGGEHTPSVTEFTEDIGEDAVRRDFKCNAIYYDIKN